MKMKEVANKRIPKLTIVKATNNNYKQVAECIVKLSLARIELKKDAS